MGYTNQVRSTLWRGFNALPLRKYAPFRWAETPLCWRSILVGLCSVQFSCSLAALCPCQSP
jgi:hypothetical protein